MSFQPVVVGNGLAAWTMLKSTMAHQRAAFADRTDITRQADHFRAATVKHQSAADLVADRRALLVALGAHGLTEDIENRYFVSRVLANELGDPDALANKLSDDRYKSLARDFSPLNYSQSVTATNAFTDSIIAKFTDVAFETAIGEVNGNIRLALAVHRLLPEIGKDNTTNDAAWFRIMGQPALRMVVETAFGLPSSFGQLDIDRQLAQLKQSASRIMGTDQVSEIASEDQREKLVQRFLLQAQLAETSSAAAMQTALTLVSQTATFLKNSRR